MAMDKNGTALANRAFLKKAVGNEAVSEISDLVFETEEVVVAGLIGKEKDLDQFSKALNERFPNQYNTISVPAFEKPNYYCEITPKGVNKWTGIQKLLKNLKIVRILEILHIETSPA